MKLLILFIGSMVALSAIVRFMPSQLDRWHIDPATPKATGRNGVFKIIQSQLSDFDAIATSTPRVRTLAGSTQEGLITYVARSKIFGFPDYITVKQVEGELLIYSRQRFGGSDWGVNAARLSEWARLLGNPKRSRE